MSLLVDCTKTSLAAQHLVVGGVSTTNTSELERGAEPVLSWNPKQSSVELYMREGGGYYALVKTPGEEARRIEQSDIEGCPPGLFVNSERLEIFQQHTYVVLSRDPPLGPYKIKFSPRQDNFISFINWALVVSQASLEDRSRAWSVSWNSFREVKEAALGAIDLAGKVASVRSLGPIGGGLVPTIATPVIDALQKIHVAQIEAMTTIVTAVIDALERIQVVQIKADAQGKAEKEKTERAKIEADAAYHQQVEETKRDLIKTAGEIEVMQIQSRNQTDVALILTNSQEGSPQMQRNLLNGNDGKTSSSTSSGKPRRCT